MINWLLGAVEAVLAEAGRSASGTLLVAVGLSLSGVPAFLCRRRVSPYFKMHSRKFGAEKELGIGGGMVSKESQRKYASAPPGKYRAKH
jgi:hypothetical protein